MRVVSVDELVTQKILPFDLFNENGDKIFSTGEVLTPGKLLQLRYVSVLYREDTKEDEEQEDEVIEFEDISDNSEEDSVEEDDSPDEETPKDKKQKSAPKLHTEDSRTIHHVSYFPIKIQTEIKEIYSRAIKISKDTGLKDNLDLCIEARDRIIEETLPLVDEVLYKSRLQFHGNHNQSHAINVAILSVVLSSKLRLSEAQIRDVVLAALLHDVGETQLPQYVLNKQTPSAKETKLIQLHTQLGYKMIKEEMNQPEHIARVALEHHERNDGTGYPFGISGESIGFYSSIIAVCDVYDKLTSQKGHIKVKNSKEAIKVMLDLGSKWFIPNILYTFVHMTNYNDVTSLEV